MTRRSMLGVGVLLAAFVCPSWAHGQQSASPTECTGATEPIKTSQVLQLQPPAQPAGGVRWRELIAATLALLTAGAGLSYVVANERRRRGCPSDKPIDRTPYVTGALIGLLFAMSLVGLRHPVGASGALQNLMGWLGHRLTPSVRYWGDVIPIGLTWQVLVIVGVIAGSMTSAGLADRLRLSTMPEQGWAEVFGPSRARRWVIAFFAAALIEYSAAIAGGCTSGLALSGGIVLAPAAFLFMAAMFLSGTATAWLVNRRKSSGGIS